MRNGRHNSVDQWLQTPHQISSRMSGDAKQKCTLPSDTQATGGISACFAPAQHGCSDASKWKMADRLLHPVQFWERTPHLFTPVWHLASEPLGKQSNNSYVRMLLARLGALVSTVLAC